MPNTDWLQEMVHKHLEHSSFIFHLVVLKNQLCLLIQLLSILTEFSIISSCF